jgi:hypothetical protein
MTDQEKSPTQPPVERRPANEPFEEHGVVADVIPPVITGVSAGVTSAIVSKVRKGPTKKDK